MKKEQVKILDNHNMCECGHIFKDHYESGESAVTGCMYCECVDFRLVLVEKAKMNENNKVSKAIKLLRDSFKGDGAEDESVQLVCTELELLVEERQRFLEFGDGGVLAESNIVGAVIDILDEKLRTASLFVPDKVRELKGAFERVTGERDELQKMNNNQFDLLQARHRESFKLCAELRDLRESHKKATRHINEALDVFHQWRTTSMTEDYALKEMRSRLSGFKPILEKCKDCADWGECPYHEWQRRPDNEPGCFKPKPVPELEGVRSCYRCVHEHKKLNEEPCRSRDFTRKCFKPKPVPDPGDCGPCQNGSHRTPEPVPKKDEVNELEDKVSNMDNTIQLLCKIAAKMERRWKDGGLEEHELDDTEKGVLEE